MILQVFILQKKTQLLTFCKLWFTLCIVNVNYSLRCSNMKKVTIIPIPVKKALEKLGSDIKEARIRRRISKELMAKRAGITRPTLTKIEQGDATASIGVYAKVLFILGLDDNLSNIADIRNDKVGIMIESNSLPKTARAIKNKEVDNG